MGSGGFVIATVRYMASELLKAKMRDPNCLELRGVEKPDFNHLQRCKREIIENCIFGVDINPLAIELARTSLYLEALVPGEPLPFLHHRLKSGNSLIGADFQGRALTEWDDGQDFPILFDLPINSINIKKDVWQSWETAYGHQIVAEDLKEQFNETLKERRTERKKISTPTWTDWAIKSQTKVQKFLIKAKEAISEFEKIQSSGAIVDALDERHKDLLSHIPDMDPVLIEAYDVAIDPKLMAKRRNALVTELGKQTYDRIVGRQRAFYRLRALGDLSVAMWYWPLDQYKFFPTHKTFQEISDWLLNDSSLDRKQTSKSLSREALKSLRIALKTARSIGTFHWEIEYAQVFADMTRPSGFDAVISNPPWKIVGVKDKEVYPTFDPQFMDVKPAQKVSRIKTLNKAEKEVSKSWFNQNFISSHLTEYWRKGKAGEIAPDGKVDLCVLFVLRTERLAHERGRTGLVVSRSSLFVNKATKSLRQRFFREWGLQESCSFVNTLKIFEIDSRVEFSILVGQNGNIASQPRFIHGLVDPNTLDVVARNLDTKNVSAVKTGPKPADLTEEIISNYFSKENLSVPGITDPRQVEIAMALHRASGQVIYMNELEVTVQQGINQTTGPKQGLSQFSEKIPAKELPEWGDITSGKAGKWVPVARGRDFDLFNPVNGNSTFSQHLARQNFESPIDLNSPLLAIRRISQVGNQRTLICAKLPQGIWVEANVLGIQTKNNLQLDYLTVLFSSLAVDYLTRLSTSGVINFSQIFSIPIPNYSSPAIDIAIRLINENNLDQLTLNARISALVWIHYGFGKPPLNRDSLEWIITTGFDCLNRHNPHFKNLVLDAFDEYISDLNLKNGPNGTIFESNLRNLNSKRPAKSNLIGKSTGRKTGKYQAKKNKMTF
jgi:hypothetical protein